MRDIWNRDPEKWLSLPLVDRIEAMRKWHCTGPCGQSSTVLGTRAALDATLMEAMAKLSSLVSAAKEVVELECHRVNADGGEPYDPIANPGQFDFRVVNLARESESITLRITQFEQEVSYEKR